MSITVPSGAVILNLKPDSSSLKSSNMPAIVLLPAKAAASSSTLPHRGANTALGCRPDGLVKACAPMTANAVRQDTCLPINLRGEFDTSQ